MNRRGFLKTMLALAVAPAIVKAENIMKVVVPPEPRIMTLWGDGVHDDTVAFQTWINGGSVVSPDGRMVGHVIDGGEYRVTDTLKFSGQRSITDILMTHCRINGSEIPESKAVLYFDHEYCTPHPGRLPVNNVFINKPTSFPTFGGTMQVNAC